MEILKFDRWTIEYDAEATRRAYAEIQLGGADECVCGACKNFAAVRDEVYPTEVRQLFDKLGIDYRKEVEAWDVEMDDQTRFWGIWFHFVGKILAVELAEGDRRDVVAYENLMEEPSATINGRFSLKFSNRRDVLQKPFESHPVVQVDCYSTSVPWILGSRELPYEDTEK